MKISKGVAFLMDMGTGKTITTIAVVGALNNMKLVKRLLVIRLPLLQRIMMLL